MNLLPSGPGAAFHPAGASLSVGIRPEELRLGHEGACDATVVGTSFQGSETVVTLSGPGKTHLLSVLHGGDRTPNAGETVRLSAAPSALHFFDPVIQTRVEPVQKAEAS